MNGKDYGWAAGLLALAAFIWLRDRSWLSTPEDTMPLFAALPLLFILAGGKALFARAATATGPRGLQLPVAAVLLLVLGIAFTVTTLLALAWTLFLWLWLRERAPKEELPSLRRLLVLAFLAFPWLTEDLPSLGWWFRLTAAGTAAFIFHLAGFNVIHEGTGLTVQGLPVEVTAACSGLTALQAMLVAGTVLAYSQLGDRRWYWGAVAFLPLVAWGANTLRVMTLSSVALTFGIEAAKGWFHEWGGWFVLVAMFALCWGSYAAARRWLPK